MSSSSRAGLLVLVAASGCRDVLVADDDASGGAGAHGNVSSSSSGAAGGGGAEPVPRVITVDYRGHGDPPLDGGRMIVSDADGTVREVLLPSELPAEVVVTDGQLVTFLRFLDGLEIPLRIESFRVSPNVTTILGGYPPFALCDVEPMLVTVDFAEVPFADDYLLVPSVVNKSAIASEPGILTLEVATCDATFDLLAYARGGGELLGYEVFKALPFVSGGALALSTAASSNEHAVLDLTIDGLDEEASVSAYADWRFAPYNGYPLRFDGFSQASPPPVVEWSTASILPGGFGYGEVLLHVTKELSSVPSGACTSNAGRLVIAPSPGVSQTFSLDHGLAPVEAVGSSGWAFTTPGELGDDVWISMTLGSEDGPSWFLEEDPAFQTAPAVFPVLPSDIPQELIPPTTTPTLGYVGHNDYDDLAGYGEQAAGVTTSGTRRSNSTSYVCD